jgi:hypothetical protein
MRGWRICKGKTDWGINHELVSIDWVGLLCCMAHAHFYVFCSCNVGVLGRRGNFLSDWNFARFLSLVHLKDWHGTD